MALHWKILLGIVLGCIVGVLAVNFGFSPIVKDYIKPFGTIFISLLKLIAIPLILVSLVKGIVDLQDISKFKTMGVRTFGLYIFTTILAVSVGLLLANLIQPGSRIDPTTIQNLAGDGNSMQSKIENAEKLDQTGPLQFLVDMVPDNFFAAASSNTNMLQVIFFAVFFGIALLLTDTKKASPIIAIFDGLNDVVMKMVDLIMLMAPFAVFALLASLVSEITQPDIFISLGYYMMTVVLGLLLMLVIYSILVLIVAKIGPKRFFDAILPAQLLAFSTSSSAATLPVTMERVEEHLGVDKEVTSFVCPLGATINMDGTSLYQAVAAYFICEALQFPLTFSDQLTIVLTATLASIGSAAVPGAGLIMLVIVLESLDLPAEQMAIGLALIFAVDRPLDMLRTVINVTGDCVVASIIGKWLGKISPPQVKEWNDNYQKGV